MAIIFRILLPFSISLVGLVSSAPTSDTKSLNSLSDVFAGQNMNSGTDSSLKPLIDSLSEVAEHGEDSEQRIAASDLRSWMQKADTSESGLGTDSITQLDRWYASHGNSTQFANSAELENWIKGYTGNGASLTKRDSPAVAATQEQRAALKKYAMVASGAYCVARIPTWSCTQCRQAVSDGKIVKTFDTPITDTNGFIMTSASEKTIYLSFRGSISSRNWMTNFNYPLTKFLESGGGASVHSGFYNAIKDSAKTYVSVIKSLLDANPEYKIVVTGHSLGGALALLGGVQLFSQDSRINSSNLVIYTYGGPRVGDKKFSDYIEQKKIFVMRSVNKLDSIPQTPPRYLGYIHPGTEAWTRTTGSTVVCNGPTESSSCSYSAAALANSITDHLRYEGLQMGVCL